MIFGSRSGGGAGSESDGDNEEDDDAIHDSEGAVEVNAEDTDVEDDDEDDDDNEQEESCQTRNSFTVEDRPGSDGSCADEDEDASTEVSVAVRDDVEDDDVEDDVSSAAMAEFVSRLSLADLLSSGPTAIPSDRVFRLFEFFGGGSEGMFCFLDRLLFPLSVPFCNSCSLFLFFSSSVKSTYGPPYSACRKRSFSKAFFLAAS